MLYDGDTFEHRGLRFRVQFPYDDHHGAPWEECDGHGPVSDWTTRDKRPGELILATEGRHRRYYDFQAAVALARSESWGFLPGKLETTRSGPEWVARVISEAPGKWGCVLFEARAIDINAAVRAVYRMHRQTMTARQYAAGAAMLDFDFLRRFCNDDWHYVGVVVTLLDHEGEDVDDRSIWGFDSDSRDYLTDTAHELADELADEHAETLAAAIAEERPDLAPAY
jgi:hypothetical protein